MTLSPRASLLAGQVRVLFVQAGLREAEADALLGQLRAERSSGSLPDEAALRGFLEKWATEHPSMGKVPTAATRIGGAIATVLLGAAGSALWDVLKAEFSKDRCTTVTVPNPAWYDEILIEWAGCFPRQTDIHRERLLRRALELRKQRLKSPSQKVAVSLDALGMLLDSRGRHREAMDLRKAVLSLETKLYGRHHENTAAAAANFGICLAAQRKFEDAEPYLVRALAVMKQRMGDQHIWTAAAAYNLFHCLKAQGRFPISQVPRVIAVAEPQIRNEAAQLMEYKSFLLAIDAGQELLEELRRFTSQHGGTASDE